MPFFSFLFFSFLFFSFLFGFDFLFWDRVSLYNHDCCGILFVDQAGLELTEIHLPLPPVCWDHPLGLCFWDRLSHSLGWPQTGRVVKNDLKFPICVLLPLWHWDCRETESRALGALDDAKPHPQPKAWVLVKLEVSPMIGVKGSLWSL